MNEKPKNKWSKWGIGIIAFNVIYTLICLGMGIYIFSVLIPNVTG